MTVLCTSLGVVCIFDYKKRKIPNSAVALIFAAGLAEQACKAGWKGMAMYLFVTAAALFALYPIFRIGGLGAGDVKLLSVCAGYFSVNRILYFLFFSMLFSAFFSMIRLLRERSVRDRIAYFCAYCMAVAQSGRWRLYLPQGKTGRLDGVCMSGPILCSVLIGLGGLY
ncbi:MAG: prepilin peptidase [Muribaculum sp.]|nr:prepilin peptidase [Muribaculum sp.]